MKAIQDVVFEDINEGIDTERMTISDAFDVLFLPKTATQAEVNEHYRLALLICLNGQPEDSTDAVARKFKVLSAAKAKIDQPLESSEPSEWQVYFKAYNDDFHERKGNRSLLSFFLKVAPLWSGAFREIPQEVADTVRPYQSDDYRQRDVNLWKRGLKTFLVNLLVGLILAGGLVLVALLGCGFLIAIPIQYGREQLAQWRRNHTHQHQGSVAQGDLPRSACPGLRNVVVGSSKMVLFFGIAGVMISPFLAIGLVRGAIQFLTYPLVCAVRIPYRRYITERDGAPHIGENWSVRKLIGKIRQQISRMKATKEPATVTDCLVMGATVAQINWEYVTETKMKQKTSVNKEDSRRCCSELYKAMLDQMKVVEGGESAQALEPLDKAANDFLTLFENDHRPSQSAASSAAAPNQSTGLTPLF